MTKLEIITIATGFFLVLMGWFATLLAQFELFRLPFLIAGVGLALIGALSFFFYQKSGVTMGSSRSDMIAVFLIFILATFISLFPHDSFLGRRDDGIYTLSAVNLSQNHTFNIPNPFLTISPSYNISGMITDSDGRNFRSKFYLGYTSWLAINYSLFGLNGIKYANWPLLMLAFLSLFAIGKNLKDRVAGLATVLMFGSSYPMIWFGREKFSDVMALALLWFGLFSITIYQRSNKTILLPIALASFGLLSATRPEGIVIIIIFLFYLIWVRFRDSSRSITHVTIFLTIVTIAHYLVSNLLISTDAFRQLLPSVAISFRNLALEKLAVQHTISATALGNNHPRYILEMLSHYNLLWAVLLAPILGIAALIKTIKERSTSSKWFQILLVGLFVVPFSLYLYRLLISTLQPWFLRRYLWHILPVAFLFSSVLIAIFLRRKALIVIMTVVIVTNIYLTRSILFFREYEGMVENLAKIANLVPDQGYVIANVDTLPRYEIADGLFLMFGKKTMAVIPEDFYLFNLNSPEVRNLYLITDATSEKDKAYSFTPFFVPGSLEIIDSQDITIHELKKTCGFFTYGIQLDSLEFSEIEKSCPAPQQIIATTHELLFYKVQSNYLRLLQQGARFDHSGWIFANNQIICPKGNQCSFVYAGKTNGTALRIKTSTPDIASRTYQNCDTDAPYRLRALSAAIDQKYLELNVGCEKVISTATENRPDLSEIYRGTQDETKITYSFFIDALDQEVRINDMGIL